jgi:hypothetical protein
MAKEKYARKLGNVANDGATAEDMRRDSGAYAVAEAYRNSTLARSAGSHAAEYSSEWFLHLPFQQHRIVSFDQGQEPEKKQ